MDDIYAHLDDVEDLAVTWTVETVPDGLFLAMARAVGGSIASAFGRSQRAVEAAAMINPRKTLYEIGMDAVRAYEARSLTHENHVTVAEYF